MNDKKKEQCTTPVTTNHYFHELEQKEIDALIADKKTIGFIMETYKQPDWCKYPNALKGRLGCWSLMDLTKDGLRTKISKDFCKGCLEFTEREVKNCSIPDVVATERKFCTCATPSEELDCHFVNEEELIGHCQNCGKQVQ
jgi:hypothetical protein